MPSPDLLRLLCDPTRPTFTFGCTPPREGTTEAEARRICAAYASRSSALATDGFVVYSLVDESVRTTLPRPFPFRATMDAALFASYFFAASGKRCVVYKPVFEATPEAFDAWLAAAVERHAHTAFTLVGAPSASAAAAGSGLSLLSAFARAGARPGIASGAVAIAERHLAKGNEHENMLRKAEAGASWFITQGIFDAPAVVRLLCEYGDLCRARKVQPRKVILTFAPVGRRKTLEFIKWLGMSVPAALEERIFAAANPVEESIAALGEVLQAILAGTSASGVPLGLNVESVSIVKEEIDGAHRLFQLLQVALLNASGSPWAVRWYRSSDALEAAEGEATRALAVLRKEVGELARGRGGDGALLALSAGLGLSAGALAALCYLLGRSHGRR